MSFRAVPLEGGGKSQGSNLYGDNPNSTIVWNRNFGDNPLDYTSSNTAAGGRMTAEYLGGANKVMGAELKMIPNYIYFYHLDKFCVLPLYPESITDNLPTEFAESTALSRTAPVFSYVRSGPRDMQITLELHRDMMNDLNRGISNLKANVVDFNGEDYIDTLVKYLQSIALPKYRSYSSGSKSVEPPMVAVRFGNSVFIKGVVSSGIQVTYKKPIMVGDKYAQVTVGFTVKEFDPYDAESVVKLGSFRGVTSGNNIFRG